MCSPELKAAEGTDQLTKQTHAQVQTVLLVLQNTRGKKRIPTHVTLKRLFSCVRPLMLIQTPFLAEGLAAL